MNLLSSLMKFLDKHGAELVIDHRADPPERVLRVPARRADDGTIDRYGLEYRLGAYFPQPAPPPASPPDSDFLNPNENPYRLSGPELDRAEALLHQR